MIAIFVTNPPNGKVVHFVPECQVINRGFSRNYFLLAKLHEWYTFARNKWYTLNRNSGTLWIGIIIPEVLGNGDTKKQLLARSRYLLFKSGNKWSEKQKKRAAILFELYPDLKKAYSLTHSLRMIFTKNTDKGIARTKMAKWFNDVTESGVKSFNTISATFYSHYPEILNFFDNRSTNASAELFNAKLKTFRATLRGVVDIEFFLFRVANIYA